MIYRFTLISDEVDDFVREIQIDPEATFYDFHEAIVKSVGYTNDQMTSFFICDDDWEKEKEITLEEMDDNPEMDSWVMKDTTISELIEDEKQKLLYVFDYMTERCFFIELSEIITGKEMKGAKCTKKEGDAPKQTIDSKKWQPTADRLIWMKTSMEIRTLIWKNSTRKVSIWAEAKVAQHRSRKKSSNIILNFSSADNADNTDLKDLSLEEICVIRVICRWEMIL